MEKTGIDHIKCVLCSKEAIKGTQPPKCIDHVDENKALNKNASGEPRTIREFADNPKEAF